MKNGVLYKALDDRELITVPRTMRNEIIRNAHRKGHFAISKTEDVKQDFYIPELRKAVESGYKLC